MSLTFGRGPLAQGRAGRLNFEPPDHVIYLEPLGRRVRAVKHGTTVIDSDDVLLVHESGQLARYLLPIDDVHVDARPLPGFDGYVVVSWDSVDAWFEEDERVFVHPRDPYHRIDTFLTSRRVEVRIDDVVVAKSTRAKSLYETALPVRYYLPFGDVNRALLVLSETVTECAYKGMARHWSATIHGRTVDDVAWTYESNVLREGEPIEGLIAFYNERVDLRVDGNLLERPITKWSR